MLTIKLTASKTSDFLLLSPITVQLYWLSPCRLHVLSVFPEGNDNYWDTESVFITFRLFPADATFVAALTKQIQEPNSALYNGHVTRVTDALYGLVALQWDYSLKLMYSIPIVGENDVVDSEHGRYLNQGSLQSCVDPDSNTKYCIFEIHLVNDMERALELQSGQFIVLFIKEADMHSVIVSFRLVPEVSMDRSGQDTVWVQTKVSELMMQIVDSGSRLYSGNVTFKTDPTWGISGISKQPRQFSKYLSRPAPLTSSDAYERCKATHRCPRAWSQYNQSSAQSSHTYQEYRNGRHVGAALFLDFEDWRRGIRGWEQSCRGDNTEFCLPTPVSEETNDKPAGAHWSPFDFDALGPNIPTFGNIWNNGLVLNKKQLELDTNDQVDLIQEHESLVAWLDEEFQHGVADDAMLRSRNEIRDNIPDLDRIITDEKEVLEALSSSQMFTSVLGTEGQWTLIFNTSDASLSGAVNATGVIATTQDGTEVALWAFDSIDIDEHVNVTLTGQRAMALVSRSSVRINTTLRAIPGTLGGFPGGFSVARRPSERLVRVCNEGVDAREFLGVCKGQSACCPGDQPVSELSRGINSNNVNGPGSTSTRVYLMTLETSAPIVNEVQSLTTSADRGQTLSGGFRLQFNGYTTPLLPHDIASSDLKRKMEDSLNPAKRNQLSSFDRTESVAGIGAVDVTRETFGSSGGYRWGITFTTAVGNIGKESSRLTATNHLVSKGAGVDVETARHGNSIGGQFALRFLGNETRLMRHDVSASKLQEILLQDITSLSTVHVLRSDPTSNCNDGYCDNGVDRSGGYTWTLTLTTQVGNKSPFSPTSRDFDDEGEIADMTALNHLSGCVDSQCPTIQIEMGHSKSHNIEMRSIDGTKPFSLAYGGAGAGYGGKGGDGFGDLPPGNAHGNEHTLYGGSGGGVGVKQPFQLGIFKQPRARGGSGGGAIEIVATNDIVIGSNAHISCDGEAGADGYMSAGGGGSGGTIRLASGGVVVIDGKLSVAGGIGGHKKANLPNKVESFGGHGGGGSGGRMAFYGQSVMLGVESTTLLDGGNCSAVATTSRNCTGQEGTLVAEAALDLDTRLIVDSDAGAAGTRSSLYLRPRDVRPPLNPPTLLSSTKSGPEFDLGASVRPNRVTFHFRVLWHDSSKLGGWDATFELRESRWSYLSSKPDIDYTAVVGIAIGKELRHGVNYIGMSFDDEHIKQLNTIHPSVKSNTWTKVDIRFDWKNHTHNVYVDDVRVVQSSPFQGESIRALSVGNYYEGGQVWFDEIYVGEDTTMDFICPVVQPDGTLQMDRPSERGWKMEDLRATSSLRPMQRHESHVSRRAMYQRDDNKFVVPFDGQGENEFSSDVKFRSKDGDRIYQEGQTLAGSLLRLPREKSSSKLKGFHGMHPDTFMWYGEHDHVTDPRQVSGAVMACSTQDFVTWRNEGAMLHYTNLTDMVNGPTGPLHAEKPKVIYNNSTQQYVMWMIIDNGIRELGMAGVAVCNYPNGPFEFVRSLYPDGNQTRDQTLFQDDDGTAYLFRTYYDTIEYVLPKAVMQPTWESVKNADGSPNFALSFHRAEYEPGYDDYHDIYLQRWRTEDQPWKVICVNRLTHQEREVPYGQEHLNFDGDICQDPFEYKKVLGQGNPMQENSKNGIQSRFLDPNDPANNAWIPNSVPGVKGQSWKASHEDGTCGKRKINDDMQHFDPNLPQREQPDRGDCSNIADNPIYSTLPDKRIGPETVVERRRAKYVAVSRLTDDYLDTSGTIKTFEGELEGADLLSLVREYNNESSDLFGWKSEPTDDDVCTTFQARFQDSQFAQAKNSDLEHHQYEKLFNDRAYSSTACVYDGQCPTNFQ